MDQELCQRMYDRNQIETLGEEDELHSRNLYWKL